MPVEALEVFEEQHELLDVREREPVIDAVERMRDGVREVFRGEIFLQLEDVLAPRLQFPVLPRIDAPHEHVDFATGVGKARAHLLAEERARAAGDLEAAVDRVVVGDRDEVHAPRVQRVVERGRRGVAVGQTHAAEEPLGRAIAVAGVDVEIGFH